MKTEALSSAATGRRVLLVDDHEDARETLALLVRLWGHDLRVAPDGASALELCRTFKPEIAILDIGLPKMSGYELARRLREIPGLSDMVLIALTGHGHEEARRRSVEAGIDHHAVKPPDADELRALIAACRRSSSAR